MEIKELTNKIYKLINSENKDDLLLAKNILSTYSEFETAYIEKKINRLIINEGRILTIREMHNIAKSEKDLELVKDLYKDAINTIADLQPDEYELNLKLRKYADSIQH